ncbi:MAG: nucleotide exchange factor GrpE [Tissierellia bacterium]|nr:nucleotide exchange factor GrpE [Tissierellia bacterium]
MNVNKNDLNKEEELEEEKVEETEKEVIDEDIINEDSDSNSISIKDDEIEDLKSKLTRLQADFVNYKRRAEKDRESSIDFGIESIVCDLLPIIDNFQRALTSEVDKDDNFYKGVSLIEQQLIEMLKNNSVHEIEALGKEFDPNYHHAVTMEESTEYESGIVIEILQKGYMLKDKVLRPSMVKVSK